MPPNIYEEGKTRRTQHYPWARTDQQTRRYYIEHHHPTDNDKAEDEALTQLKTVAPDCIQVLGKNLIAREYLLEVIEAGHKWIGRVTYFQQQYTPKRQFDVNTSEIQIYESKETLILPHTACDYGGAINVSGENNETAGVAILRADLRYTEIHRLPLEWGQQPFMRKLLDAINKTNGDIALGDPDGVPWRGYQDEEFLFLGFTAVEVPDDIYYLDFTFEFLLHPTATLKLPFELPPDDPNYTPGNPDEIEVPGWRYVWQKYFPEETTTGQCEAVLQKPEAVYVEKIYDTIDYSQVFPPAPCQWDIPSGEMPQPQDCETEDESECGPNGTTTIITINDLPT